MSQICNESWFDSCQRKEIFFFHLTHTDRLWGPPSLVFKGYWSTIPGVKRPGCHIDKFLSSTKAKNEWNYTSTPPIQLHDMERESNAVNLNFRSPTQQGAHVGSVSSYLFVIQSVECWMEK